MATTLRQTDRTPVEMIMRIVLRRLITMGI
jgi:hypothetical protein